MEKSLANELANASEEQIRAVIAEYFTVMKRLNEQSASDQKEIEQLQSETRSIIARFPKGGINVENIIGTRAPGIFGD